MKREQIRKIQCTNTSRAVTFQNFKKAEGQKVLFFFGWPDPIRSSQVADPLFYINKTNHVINFKVIPLTLAFGLI